MRAVFPDWGSVDNVKYFLNRQTINQVGRSLGRHVGLKPDLQELWQQIIYFFDKETSWLPEENTDQAVKEKDEPAICCAFCQHPITNRKFAIDVSGSHQHVFTNPGGASFEIAMYEKTDCISHGSATTEYTWFTGYAWQVALCSNCKAHLGWYYTRAHSPGFYGLIVDHIVEN